MKSVTFTAYARKTDYDEPALKDIRLDHVFVTSSKPNNWNCFGGGIEEAKPELEIEQTIGCAEWAQLVYGIENEGKGGRRPNASPAAGIVELYNGVCQNAANRILVLADIEKDVRKANGNVFVTLLYGKYGFGIGEFIDSIRLAAQHENVPDSVLETVEARIKKGRTLEAELEILKETYEKTTGTSFASLSPSSLESLTLAYSNFQNRRQEVFDQLSQTRKNEDIREPLVKGLLPELDACYTSFSQVLGPDVINKVLQVLPHQMTLAVGALAGVRQ